MIEAHLTKLRLRAPLSTDEEAAIRGLVAETEKVPAHRTLVRQGETVKHSILCLDGWIARTKDSRSGERQILELHVAGDFSDLHGFTLKYLDHSLVTLAPTRIALVPHERIQQLIDGHPRLGKLYWLMTNIDAAVQREWTFSMGRRPAAPRLANLFCELFERLRVVDRLQGDSYELPLTQSQLGECVGLTPVHINRTLQGLRADGVIRLENRRLTILDYERLATIAEFNPDYLFMKRLL